MVCIAASRNSVRKIHDILKLTQADKNCINPIDYQSLLNKLLYVFNDLNRIYLIFTEPSMGGELTETDIEHEYEVAIRKAKAWEDRAQKAEAELTIIKNNPKAVLVAQLNAAEKRINGLVNARSK